MYRVVFTSVDPRTQILKRECGPWLPRREDAEDWAEYFNSRGHLAPATVEKGGDGRSREMM